MRAKIRLTIRELHEHLGLPADVRIVYAWADPDPLAVYLMLEADELDPGLTDDEVAVGFEAPYVHTSPPLIAIPRWAAGHGGD